MNDIVIALLDEIQPIDEPEIAFPQANDFNKLVDLCEWLHTRVALDRMVIAGNYKFDLRQENYYADAGRYLGLIEVGKLKGRKIYRLSDEGFRIMDLDKKSRNVELFKCIIRHSVFRDTLKDYLITGKVPSTEKIAQTMKKYELFNVKSDSTFLRRASTIREWIHWIIQEFCLS